jgi:ribosomal protein S18 acetylase RimI-like enzyme
LAELQRHTAEALTIRYGEGHWSGAGTENGARGRIRRSTVITVRQGPTIVASATLQTKKPWAIDRGCLTPVTRRVYLLNMAVMPALQGLGIGRRLVNHAVHVAAAMSCEAIALDAYDAPAGAGGFYARCGFQEVGRREYRGVPLIYYERLLNPVIEGGSSPCSLVI